MRRKGLWGVSFKSKDQMSLAFPPVIEIGRAQRCRHCDDNKWTQGLKSRKYRSLFDVGRVGLFCRLVERPDGKIKVGGGGGGGGGNV